MSTLLKATVAVGLVLLLIGTAQAVVLDPSVPVPPGSPRVDLGRDVDPADPLIDGYAQPFVGSILVAGGGSNIGGTDDHGFFLYEELAGDGSISGQVQSFFSGSSPERMAGVMIRDSLDADAANAASFILPTDTLVFPNVKRAQAQARTVAGDSTTIIAPAPGDTPGVADYIQITRDGDVFTFAWSPSGLPGTWVDYSSPVTIRMTGTIYVGLAVTSRNNAETASARVRNTTITGFAPAAWLTWDELGDDTWNSASWVGGPPSSPDNTTFVLVDSTNTDRITVTADAESLDLTVKGGTLAIGTGRTLKVYGAVDFQANGYLEMANGSKLSTNAGGTIENLVNIVGDSTIDILGDMQIKNFGANLFAPGTLTKAGLGTLQLDNAAGVVIAPNTTFKVSKGMLASKGIDPLGGADAVILEGTTLKLQNAGAINTATALNLPASSTLVVDDAPTASLGPLTFGAGGVQLTTSGTGGAALFASTNFAAGVGAATFNTSMTTGTGAVNLGADLVTITKTGAAKLIVSGVGTNLANATFAVNQGALVGVAASNPFGAAKITLSGGELVLANNGLDNPAVFDNAVTVTASSTLTGGKGGLTVGGPPSVRLGGANGLTVNSGQTLTVQTTDGYTLDIAGALAGTGTMAMTGGTVGLSGGGTLGRANISGGTLNMTSALAIADVRPSGGVLNTSAVLTASTRLRSTGSATVNIGDVLNATTLDVQGGVVNTAAVVNATSVLSSGGTLNSNGVLNADSITASGGTLNLNALANAKNAVLSGSALVKANQLVLTNSLVQGKTTYSVNTGTMTAKGSNLLAGVNLAFGGNTLTVNGNVNMLNGLMGQWTFDDETANDSSGHGYDGVLVGGSYSTDVPAVLGGKSVDLTAGDYYVVVDTDDPAGTDPDQNVFNLDKMTIAAWVKGWPDGSWEPFVSKEGESGRGYQLRRYSGEADNVSFTLRGAGDDYQGGDKNINDGQWHLLVATYDGATQTIYIDGAVNASRSRTGTVNDTKSRLVFGARDNSNGDPINPGNFARVRMDDIYIYNRALNADEVNALLANDLRKVPLNLTTTNLEVTSDATLVADTVQTASFGNLALNPGVALTLQTEATQPVSFGDLTAGDGSSIVGKLLVRDELSVGSSPGVLDVVGNLTLAGTSVYAWDLDSMASDLINVSGKLTLKDGWTLKVVTSEPFVYGQHKLFTYGTSAAPSVPNFDLSEAPGWYPGALELDVDMAGNVFLIVPEPATLVMLLAAGVAGLFYARRRRQAT